MSDPTRLPRIALELEACDGCCKVFTIDRLFPVVAYGLMCAACVDHLRDTGLDAA